ncbi:MAG: hypothetical protein R2698_09695 [Microthrixaceae bacterium]
MRLGSDPSQLESLAAALRRAGRTAAAAERELADLVRNVAWHGSDASRFRREWRSGAAALHAGAALLDERAADLRRQAHDQRLVSALGELAPAGGAAADDTPGRLAPPADVVRLMSIAGSGGGAIVGSAGFDAIVEDLPGPRAKVSVREHAGLGVGASGGTGATLGVSAGAGSVEASLGSAVGADAQVVAGVSRTWNVDDDAVDDLLVRVALHDAAVAGASALGPLIGPWVSASLGDRVGPGMPDSIGVDVGTALDGGGWASAGSVRSVAAGLGAEGLVGMERDRRTGTVTMELSTHAAGSLSAAVAGVPEGVDGSAEVRARLRFDGRGRPRSLEITETSVGGDEVTVRRRSVDLSSVTGRDVERFVRDTLDPAPRSRRVRSTLRAALADAATRTDRYRVGHRRTISVGTTAVGFSGAQRTLTLVR